jgi:hypothetical protein
MTMTQDVNNYTHTVHCFDDKAKRKHFTNRREAVAYANRMLVKGHKARIFPYAPRKQYVDIVAEGSGNILTDNGSNIILV